MSEACELELVEPSEIEAASAFQNIVSSMIPYAGSQPVAITPTLADIERIEAIMLRLPAEQQVDVKTWNGTLQHHFAPGIYIRDGVMPKGSFVIGHQHKTEHINMMLTGRMLLLMDGQVTEVRAPFIVKSAAGVRKMGYMLEDVRWINVHTSIGLEACGEDPDKLEDRLVTKSEAWLKHQAELGPLLAEAQAKEIVDRYRSEAPAGCDPQNISAASAAVIATVAVGAIAAGATAYSAVSASNSAQNATEQNAINAQNTNAANLYQFDQSRGAGGSAIYPIYAKGAEQQLYGDTLNTYDATAGMSAQQIQAIANQNAGAQAGANNTVNQVYNGGLLANENAAQGQVNQANQTAVQTQKQGTLEALQQTLNNIKSIQAGKGFVGGGSGNDQLAFNARLGANTTAANAQSQANIANATALQGINNNNNSRMLANVGLPGQIAQSNVALANLCNTTAEQNQVARQNLFGNFRIGTQAFQYAPLPQVNPVASTGQIIGQGVGALAGAAGNYASNQQLINGLNGGGGSVNGGYGYGPTYGTGATGAITNPANNPTNYNANGGYVPPSDINGNYSFGDG